MCIGGDAVTASSFPQDVTDYTTSQENYVDCVFSPSCDTQKMDDSNHLDSNQREDEKKLYI